MGKRGKERKRKRAGLTPEPGVDAVTSPVRSGVASVE